MLEKRKRVGKVHTVDIPRINHEVWCQQLVEIPLHKISRGSGEHAKDQSPCFSHVVFSSCEDILLRFLCMFHHVCGSCGSFHRTKSTFSRCGVSRAGIFSRFCSGSTIWGFVSFSRRLLVSAFATSARSASSSSCLSLLPSFLQLHLVQIEKLKHQVMMNNPQCC